MTDPREQIGSGAPADADGTREVVISASAFGALRRELAAEAGELPAIHALQSAGYTTGQDSARRFRTQRGAGDLCDLQASEFWSLVGRYLAARGWGHLGHEPAGDAVGLLKSGDWAESEPGGCAPDQGACAFTTGFLSGFLSDLAGGRVAVLEVSCAGRGQNTCTFAFGSEGAIHELYGKLVHEGDVGVALASL